VRTRIVETAFVRANELLALGGELEKIGRVFTGRRARGRAPR
jgi:hypothetical protein